MGYSFPESVYDRTHPYQNGPPPFFQNVNDADQYHRMDTQERDPVAQRKMQIALMTADPATPEAEIQANLTVPLESPVVEATAPLTPADCFNLDPRGIKASNNFSGGVGEINATSTPAMPMW